MEPEIIDWSNVESVFIEDFVYEHFNAPMWVDLFAPDEFVDDEAWFCRPNCKHPKCAEDFVKPPRDSKVKILRSVGISEIFPFKDWKRRNGNQRGRENNLSASEEKSNAKNLLNTKKKVNSWQFSHEDCENSNPNVSLPPFSGKGVKGSKQCTMKSVLETKEQVVDDLHTNIPKMEQKPKLRNAFSARNLIGGRDILSQLTGFCSELKNLTRRKSKKGSSENVAGGTLGEKGGEARQRERAPLLAVREGTV